MLFAWTLGCLCFHMAYGQVTLTGRVTDENQAAVAGAIVSVAPTRAGTEIQAARGLSGPTGEFRLQLTRTGQYSVSVEREGYFRIEKRPVEVQADQDELSLMLVRVKELVETVDVKASLPGIDFDRTSTTTTLTGTEIIDVPYATTNNLKNALALNPGTVQDQKGGLHVNGGDETQTLYTLQGFNITNPLTGKFDTRLSVEGVQSATVSSGAYSAEFGKGTSGTLAIQTKTGDDKFRYAATNFFPGIETSKGLYIGGWTPRGSISGPIVKGRAWFFNSMEAQYDKYVMKELPRGKDQAESWRIGDMLSTQVNLTPSNILTSSFLLNLWTAPQSGLGLLDPPSTTVDRRSRQWFFNIKDQIYLGGGALFEFGYANNRTFGREIPQGHALYVLTPEGKQGNYYVDGRYKASRDQWIANMFLPSFSLWGRHQFKTGVDLDLLNYWQDVRRTGYEQYRVDNTLSRIVTFGGQGLLGRENFEVSTYFTDSWRVRENVQVDLGVRQDWDEIRRRIDVSPRVGVAWRPAELKNTKISGGFAIVHDATSLRLFTRPMDQYASSLYFAPDGSVGRGPALTMFQIDNERLASPRSQNWNASVEQRLPRDLYVRFSYLRRRGERGFAYLNEIVNGAAPPAEPIYVGSEFDALYGLTNGRRDSYTAYDVTMRKAFKGEYMLMGNYTRSRALSTIAADVNIDDPITYSASASLRPLPWDAPNRAMAWGILPFPGNPGKKWAVAFLFEWRDGFPFSAYDDDGKTRGDVNSYRLPDYLNLNLHVERKLRFRNQLWALRGGFNNITNHQNPVGVNANMSSPNFLMYYGGRGRSMNFRIRWLGKV